MNPAQNEFFTSRKEFFCMRMRVAVSLKWVFVLGVGVLFRRSQWKMLHEDFGFLRAREKLEAENMRTM